MVLAILISLVMQFDQLAWTVITILILSLPEVGTTWMKAFSRIIGTLVGAAGGMAMIAMFPQSPIMMLITFSFVLFCGLYLSATMITTQYAYFMVVVTMIIVSTSAWDDPLGVQQLAIERFQNTMLGVLCVTFGATCLWPVRAEDRLVASMVDRIVRARRRLERVLQLIDGDGQVDTELELLEHSPLAEQLTMFQAASMESHVVARHRETIMVLLTVVDRLGAMAAEIEQELDSGSLDSIDESLRGDVRATIRSAADALRTIETAHAEGASRLPDELVAGARATAERLAGAVEHDEAVEHLSLLSTVVRLGRNVDRLRVLDQWCAGNLVDVEAPVGATPLLEARLNRSVLEPFHQINRLACRTAIKATIASVAALLLVASMHWTSVGATAVVTCVLVMLPTIGATVSKSIQRIAGAACGAVVGIAAVAAIAPNTLDVTLLLIMVAIVGFVSQWVMMARWDLSYTGMQFAFAFAITALAFNPPTADIDPAIDRVFGILVGLVVAFLVMWLVWPVRASGQVLFSLAEALRMMGRFAQRGLLTAAEEDLLRPLNGFRYRIAWLLADAYRYRQEARYEQKLLPNSQAPALRMGVSMQSLNLRIHALVQNRMEHDRVQQAGSLEPVRELLKAIQDRLDAVGELLEHGTPLPASELDARLHAARQAMDSIPELTSSEQLLVRTQVGYYREIVLLLPAIEQEAVDTRAVFGRRVRGL